MFIAFIRCYNVWRYKLTYIHEKSITRLNTLTYMYLQYISKVTNITVNIFKYTNYIQEHTCIFFKIWVDGQTDK